MLSRLFPFLVVALLAGAVQAAELGEPRVSSFIGQPLVADIELTMLEDPANPVQVSLAHPNVYRGANIGMPKVLNSLRMSVMRRDGRQFLHVTSLGPVESEHLHLYLELCDGSQRTVRLATLWLAPDPHPAPPPAPAPAPAAVVARAAEAPAPKPLADPHPKPLIKPLVKPVTEPATEPVAKPALKAAAARPAESRPVEPKAVAPKPAEVKPAEPRKEAKPAAAAPAAAAPAPKPAPKPAPAASQPAPAPSCAPAPAPQKADACVVLGAKNAMLREQLGQLEDKVRVLQVAVGVAPASVLPPVAPHKPRKKKEAPPPSDTPWHLIGAGGAALLALLLGILVAKRRKKAARQLSLPKVSLLSRLKARFAGKPKDKPAPKTTPAPQEEERARESSTQV